MRLRTAIAFCFVVAGCDENEPRGIPGLDPNTGDEVPNGTANAVASSSAGPSSSGAQGGGGSGGASGSAGGSPQSGTGGEGGQGGQGGEGGALPEGPLFIASSSFVDVGGRVPLRVLRTELDGTVTDITAEATLESLSLDILAFERGRAVGVAGGTATVRIVHEGRQARDEVRVRHWTHLDDFLEPGTPAGRAVGFDGSVLHGARNDQTFRLELWYAAPDASEWLAVGEGSAVGAVPLRAGRYLVPTPYDPEPFPDDRVPAVLGPDLAFTEPTPPLESLFDVIDGLPYGYGRCALILHDGGRRIRRWCEKGPTSEVEWPRADGGTALLRADERGRIGLVEQAGDLVRALVQDGDGGWAELVLDAADRSYTSMAFGPDGEGWVAWSSATDGSGIMASRITPDGFEEPELVSVVGERPDLAVLRGGVAVLHWSDPTPPSDFLPDGTFVLPAGPSLDIGGDLFGGAGGLVTLVSPGQGSTEPVWATDGTSWSASHAIETCEAFADGFAGSTPAGGFVRAHNCSTWSFDVYR
jgi:hypothetical protein